jgi:hypothetical protein
MEALGTVAQKALGGDLDEVQLKTVRRIAMSTEATRDAVFLLTGRRKPREWCEACGATFQEYGRSGFGCSALQGSKSERCSGALDEPI